MVGNTTAGGSLFTNNVFQQTPTSFSLNMNQQQQLQFPPEPADDSKNISLLATDGLHVYGLEPVLSDSSNSTMSPQDIKALLDYSKKRVIRDTFENQGAPPQTKKRSNLFGQQQQPSTSGLANIAGTSPHQQRSSSNLIGSSNAFENQGQPGTVINLAPETGTDSSQGSNSSTKLLKIDILGVSPLLCWNNQKTLENSRPIHTMPAAIKVEDLKTAPFDPSFPNTNQSVTDTKVTWIIIIAKGLEDLTTNPAITSKKSFTPFAPMLGLKSGTLRGKKGPSLETFKLSWCL